jgi:hypothetical protein
MVGWFGVELFMQLTIFVEAKISIGAGPQPRRIEYEPEPATETIVLTMVSSDRDKDWGRYVEFPAAWAATLTRAIMKVAAELEMER